MVVQRHSGIPEAHVDRMTWVTSWEAWRTVMGHAGSRQRARIDDYLKTHPAVLYWGDSWFSTPLYLNLARQSAKRIDGIGMLIGKPGAEAAGLFSAGEVERIGKRVENNPFDIVCLSAGGNDCLGAPLARVFAGWHGTPPRRHDTLTPADAYRLLVDSGVFARVLAAYDRVLKRLRAIQRKRPHLRVVGQPYVPITRIGVPADLTTANIGLIAWLRNDVGPWLWREVQPVLEDKDAAREFARLMLVDGFRGRVFDVLEQRYPGLFSAVDFSSVTQRAQDAFWYDEIHPTEHGFALLAAPFNAHIAAHLPVDKRGAVG